MTADKTTPSEPKKTKLELTPQQRALAAQREKTLLNAYLTGGDAALDEELKKIFPDAKRYQTEG